MSQGIVVNPEQLSALGTTFVTEGQAVTELTSRIASQLEATQWEGHVADLFPPGLLGIILRPDAPPTLRVPPAGLGRHAGGAPARALPPTARPDRRARPRRPARRERRPACGRVRPPSGPRASAACRPMPGAARQGHRGDEVRQHLEERRHAAHDVADECERLASQADGMAADYRVSTADKAVRGTTSAPGSHRRPGRA